MGHFNQTLFFPFSCSPRPSQSCLSRFGHQILYTNIEGTRRPQSVPTILTETVVSSFCTAWRRLAAILQHTDLLQCSTVKAWSLVKWRSLIRFCLDHSRARNKRAIRKQLKQTCRRTKQSKEKRLKHKVSGYKSLSKRRSIAGCRLLLRTLDSSGKPKNPVHLQYS